MGGDSFGNQPRGEDFLESLETDENIDEGIYSTVGYSDRAYIPKVVSVSLNFTVLHTHLVGWDEKNNFGSEEINAKYPNAFIVKRDVTTPGSSDSDSVSTQVIQSNESEVLG